MKKRLFFTLPLFLLFALQPFAANKAGIVIQNSTGEVITRCVEFEEASITVAELLMRSGFKMVTSESSFGTSVCFLHDDGIADSGNCFGHPLGWFWNFFQLDGNGWVSSDVGVSGAMAQNGTVFGFGFGGFNEVQLPQMTFDDVCGYNSRVGVVVDHSNGTRKTVVVEFPGETATGTQILQRSGLNPVISQSSFGPALCALDGEGQPAGDCFGDPAGRFWGFNLLLSDNSWTFSSVGIGEAVLRDGGVTGFIFAEFGVDQPPITKEEVFQNTSDVQSWSAYR